MAPALPTQQDLEPPTMHIADALAQDLFEGPEKKLVVHFTPHRHARACAPEAHSLRTLPRHQIEQITTAARCSILSVVSDESTDAYLLSESSLFVTSRRIVIKTCGTTTLLHALAVIIRLAASVSLQPTSVLFARVAYLFPHKQEYPHNHIVDEAAYLDDVLHTRGRVIRHNAHMSVQWFCYVASLPSVCLNDADFSGVDRCLEVYMFDLDPRVMRQFMLPAGVQSGSDPRHTGTTARVGLPDLIGDDAIVDAFNFTPCGYSMNAIGSHGTYFSVHVTPEDGASYVSFEAAGCSDCPMANATLVAKVVRTFRPARFAVASMLLGHTRDATPVVDLDVLCKALHDSFRRSSAAHVLGVSGCEASCMSVAVASFRAAHIGLTRAVKGEKARDTTSGTLSALCKEVRVAQLPAGQTVATCDVHQLLAERGHDKSFLQSGLPVIVSDLARIRRNYWRVVRDMAARHDEVELRYLARCNADAAVLASLNLCPAVVFEVCCAAECAAVRAAGVNRRRIVLSERVVSATGLACLESVGRLSVPDLGDSYVVRRARDAGVDIEMRDPCMRCSDEAGTEAEADGVDDVVLLLGDGMRQTRRVVDVSRRLMDDVCTIVLSVFSVRMYSGGVDDDNGSSRHAHYFLDDGVYGILGAIGMHTGGGDDGAEIGKPVYVERGGNGDGADDREEDGVFKSTFWGPTCDSTDRVWDGAFRKLRVGDRVAFRDVGAFALTTVTSFNGFSGSFSHVYCMSTAD